MESKLKIGILYPLYSAEDDYPRLAAALKPAVEVQVPIAQTCIGLMKALSPAVGNTCWQGRMNYVLTMLLSVYGRAQALVLHLVWRERSVKRRIWLMRLAFLHRVPP